MSMIMDKKLQEKLERVKKRESWSVTQLAAIFVRDRRTIYRHINNGDFDVLEDGGIYKKVLSKSVVEFYENRLKNIPKIPLGKEEFVKGFNAGLRIYETAEELGIDLDSLQIILANYYAGVYDVGNNE